MAPAEGHKGRVLVVEDDPYVRDSLGTVLRARGYAVTGAEGAAAALDLLRRAPIDVVLADLQMPDGNGLELMSWLRARSILTPVVILTGFGTVESAVECMRAGASDYVLKPADPEVLDAAFERALERTAEEGSELRGLAAVENEAIGSSPAWRAVLKQLAAAAPTDAPILLLGESGTGKEVLAGLAHRLSRRSTGPFVRVNCAAVPLEVWESEFFGHRKGAFTGALADRRGRFQVADKGTLFVDEIAATPREGQAKLLRALEAGEFCRLGDETPTRVDVRIVAATNSDLAADIASSRFREDLYHRLNVLRIVVPPLRERAEDIPLLARHFVQRIAQRLGRTPPELPEQTLAGMSAYSWPGNVRELRSVLERALTLTPEDGLATLDLFPVRLDPRSGLADARAGSDALTLRDTLERAEKAKLVQALRRARSVRKEAARLLGIDQRNLGYYLKKHGIDPDNPV